MKSPGAAKAIAGKSVAILGFDGFTVLDLAGPLAALTAARIEIDAEEIRACYNARIIGVNGRTFVSEANLVVTAKDTLSKASNLDTVIIPGGPGIRQGDTKRKVSEWLRKHALELTRVVSIGNGIYPLAESGLIDGRKVATHWRFGQDVARRFPKVQVDHTASFLKDGPFYTCGGGTAPTELTLALIQEDYGSRIALAAARELSMRLRPFGDHADTFDLSQFECGPNDRLAELPGWIGGHLNHNLSVEVLAERACLCPRHFGRLFKRTFGSTPASFVETLRIDEARRLLVLGRASVENVAVAVGFKDSDSFRRAFERRLGVAPATFRRQRFSVAIDNGGRAAGVELSKLSAIAPKSLGRSKAMTAGGAVMQRPKSMNFREEGCLRNSL